MKLLRRLLGILVMLAGVLGLVLSLAGLVGLWMAKPGVVSALTSTIDALNTSITTSQQTMEVTKEALGATVDSVDALSVMLASTATSIEDSTPVIEQVNTLMAVNLPDTLASATDSIKSAQQAAVVLDGSIKSLEAFQTAMSGVPLISAFVQVPTQAYNPEVPLAESLGDVATELEALPPLFVSMADDLNKADDNLGTIQNSLTTMSTSVKVISQSISEYEKMIGQSQTSVGNLAPMLTNMKNNLTRTVDGAMLVLTLFLLWLLAIQVVVLTQGWELFQGTAGRMEGGKIEVTATQPA
jgi:peptidoglycan hydrolase CwlO-like protein